MNNLNGKMIYTIFVFVALAAFDNVIIGLFPTLFSSIASDLNISLFKLGIVSAINILITSISSVYWGYLAGRLNRKKLIIIGTIIWSSSVFLTSYSSTYIELLFFQALTGIGLGCIASIGFSTLSDYIPYKFRGMILSFWGMSQGFGGILGALIASLIGTSSGWRKPFEIVSIVGFLLISLYLFIREPRLGESEPELERLVKQGESYIYKIEISQLKEVILKNSNILLLLQGFFLNISTGSLIWLPTLYISKVQQQGYGDKTAIITAGYLYALFQLGGLTTGFFGYLGDKFQRKTYKGRAILTSFFVCMAMPLYSAMFAIPMKNLLVYDESTLAILLSLLKQIVMNPWMTLIFVLSFFASAAQSANTPNWLALITDVNLPEHRGTAFSIANVASSLGRTLGNVGISYLLTIVSKYAGEPSNYIITLIIFQIFFIPAALFYIKMAESNVQDIGKVKLILRKRADLIVP